MSKIQKSLEENKAEILKALPAEHHAALEKEIQAAADMAPMSDEEEQTAIKAAVAAISDGDPEEAMSGFLKNPTAHKCPPAASEDEQNQAMEAELARVKAELK